MGYSIVDRPNCLDPFSSYAEGVTGGFFYQVNNAYLVGYHPGVYDSYACLIAGYISKYIPSNPNTIGENMRSGRGFGQLSQIGLSLRYKLAATFVYAGQSTSRNHRQTPPLADDRRPFRRERYLFGTGSLTCLWCPRHNNFEYAV